MSKQRAETARRGTWCDRHRRPNRIEEPKLPARQPLYAVTPLVHEPVMPPAEQDEVIEARLASARPVLDVVSIHEALPLAPGEAAAVVSPPQGVP